MNEPVALITDVLHFLGLSSARALHASGVKVLCHDRAFDSEEKRAAFEKDENGLKAAVNQDPDGLSQEVIETFGRIDILINNDSYPAHRMPIDKADMSVVRETVEHLLLQPYALTAAIAPQMKAQSSGKIIFITSAAPIGGLKNYSPYAAARGGVNAMVKSLALELAAHNIQVNAIAPNFIESPDYFPPKLINDPEKGPRVLKNIPLGRLGTQDEAAALVSYLASRDADFMTGQVIPFAGGWA